MKICKICVMNETIAEFKLIRKVFVIFVQNGANKKIIFKF